MTGSGLIEQRRESESTTAFLTGERAGYKKRAKYVYIQ